MAKIEADLDSRCPRTIPLEQLTNSMREDLQFSKIVCKNVINALHGIIQLQETRALFFDFLEGVQSNLSFSLLPEGYSSEHVATRPNEGYDAPLSRSQRSVLCLMVPQLFLDFCESKQYDRIVGFGAEDDTKRAVVIESLVAARDAVEGLKRTSVSPAIQWLKLFGSAAECCQETIAITDPNELDNPLVYVNTQFENETGYKRELCLGRSCRFLQGHGTDDSARQEIKKNLLVKRGCKVRILNYRKNGAAFWNLLHIKPIFDEYNKLLYYVSVQYDLGKLRTPLEIFQLQSVLDLIPSCIAQRSWINFVWQRCEERSKYFSQRLSDLVFTNDAGLQKKESTDDSADSFK